MIDFKEAYAQAFAVAEKSNDPHTKVGAVLICKPSVTPSGHEFPPPRIIGCNEIKGDDPASFERPLKYDRVIHAEVAVITGAAAHGISTSSGQGCMILTPKPPPTSGVMQSTLVKGRPSRAATAARTPVEVCVEDHSVRCSASRSQLA